MLAIGDAYHNIPDWNGLPTFIRAWSEMSKRQFMPCEVLLIFARVENCAYIF